MIISQVTISSAELADALKQYIEKSMPSVDPAFVKEIIVESYGEKIFVNYEKEKITAIEFSHSF